VTAANRGGKIAKEMAERAKKHPDQFLVRLIPFLKLSRCASDIALINRLSRLPSFTHL